MNRIKYCIPNLDERRSVKYWKRVAFNIINRVVLNAYVIYNERVESKAISRLDFMSSIIFLILCQWMNENEADSYVKEKSFGLVKLLNVTCDDT